MKIKIIQMRGKKLGATQVYVNARLSLSLSPSLALSVSLF
eukprot:COSAG05_NODE_3912_length_1776_cov_155.137150_6_plen_39_part_01